MNEIPLYKHNDEVSVFLGTCKNKDLYFLNDSDGNVSLIVRNSDKEWDYFNMPVETVKMLLENKRIVPNSPVDVCYQRYLNYPNE